VCSVCVCVVCVCSVYVCGVCVYSVCVCVCVCVFTARNRCPFLKIVFMTVVHVHVMVTCTRVTMLHHIIYK
jgi:hypothetical protein